MIKNKKILENKNISEKCNILLDQINKLFKNKSIKKSCKELSEHTSIPEKEIIFYVKKKFFHSYDFKKNEFQKKYFCFQ